MNNYRLQLQEILSFYVEEQKKYKIELESLPKGSLLSFKEDKRIQFLWKSDGKRRGINKRPDIIRQLARKEFLTKLLAEIDSNITVIQRAINEYRDVNPRAIIESMTKAYRRLQPEMFFPTAGQYNASQDVPAELLFTSEEDDIAARLASHEEWASQPYEKNPHPFGPYAQTTSRGLEVRSNRELYIAERLYHYGVPFRYDQLLHVNGYTVAPDFTFEQATKAELYLEYWGMMNDGEYVSHFFKKRSIYERCGIYEWDNMIYVFSKERKMNTREIDDVIRHLIIPRL